MKDVLPDADLGTCTKVGSRNMVRTEKDVDRAFGCPTVRTDIPAPGQRSVADPQNYGDEPHAAEVIFPATEIEKGITEGDFKRVRGKNDLRSLFDRLGYSYRPAKFNAIFNKSVEFSCELLRQQLPPDHSTVRGMMLAIEEMHEL